MNQPGLMIKLLIVEQVPVCVWWRVERWGMKLTNVVRKCYVVVEAMEPLARDLGSASLKMWG